MEPQYGVFSSRKMCCECGHASSFSWDKGVDQKGNWVMDRCRIGLRNEDGNSFTNTGLITYVVVFYTNSACSAASKAATCDTGDTAGMLSSRAAWDRRATERR